MIAHDSPDGRFSGLDLRFQELVRAPQVSSQIVAAVEQDCIVTESSLGKLGFVVWRGVEGYARRRTVDLSPSCPCLGDVFYCPSCLSLSGRCLLLLRMWHANRMATSCLTLLSLQAGFLLCFLAVSGNSSVDVVPPAPAVVDWVWA